MRELVNKVRENSHRKARDIRIQKKKKGEKLVLDANKNRSSF